MARHRSSGPSSWQSYTWVAIIIVAIFVIILCYIYGSQGVLDWFLDTIEGVETTNQN